MHKTVKTLPSRAAWIGLALLLQVTVVQAGDGAFTSPRSGDTISNRQDFQVVVEADLDTAGKHWVAIASVSYDDNWERLQELIEVHGARHPAVLEMLSEWELDLVWPKYFVSESPHHGRVFDGGQNPLHGLEPQPMVLLLLRVDDARSQFFRRWFRRGAAGQGYPGIPIAEIGENAVVARCEIFFP